MFSRFRKTLLVKLNAKNVATFILLTLFTVNVLLSFSTVGNEVYATGDNYSPQPITEWLTVENGHLYINNTDTRIVLMGVNLDPTATCVQSYLNETVRAIVKQGFNFVKIDTPVASTVSSGYWDDNPPVWSATYWNTLYDLVETCRLNGLYVAIEVGWDYRYGYTSQQNWAFFKNQTSTGQREAFINIWGKIAQTVGNRCNVMYMPIQDEPHGSTNNTVEFPTWNRWLQKRYYNDIDLLNTTWGGELNVTDYPATGVWRVVPCEAGKYSGFVNVSYNHGGEALKDYARYCVERMMNVTKNCMDNATKYDDGKPLRLVQPYASDQWGYHMGAGDFVIGASMNTYFLNNIAGIVPDSFPNYGFSSTNLTRSRRFVMGFFDWTEMYRIPNKAFIVGGTGVQYTGESYPQYMMPLVQNNYIQLYQADVDGVAWYCWKNHDDTFNLFDDNNLVDQPLWETAYTSIPYYAYWMSQMNRWFINRNQTYVQPKVAVLVETHWGYYYPTQVMFNLNLLHIPYDVIPVSWLEYQNNVSYLNRYTMLIVCGNGANNIGFNTTTFKQIVQWNKYNTTNYALYVGENEYDDYGKIYTHGSIDFSGYLLAHSQDAGTWEGVSWGDESATMKLHVQFGLLTNNTLIGRIADYTYYPRCPYDAALAGLTVIAYANSSVSAWVANSVYAWYNSTCHAAFTYDNYQNTVEGYADTGWGLPQNMTCWQRVFIPNYMRWINQTSIYGGQHDDYNYSIFNEYDGRYWLFRDFTGSTLYAAKTIGINSSLISTAKSYAVFNLTDNTNTLASVGTYTGTQLRDGVSVTLGNFSWRLYVPLPTDAVHGVTTINATLASDTWTAGSKHAEIVLTGYEGLNVSAKIYIPSGVYSGSYEVSCNETEWGDSWDASNRILTVWMVLESAGQIEIDPLGETTTTTTTSATTSTVAGNPNIGALGMQSTVANFIPLIGALLSIAFLFFFFTSKEELTWNSVLFAVLSLMIIMMLLGTLVLMGY